MPSSPAGTRGRCLDSSHEVPPDPGPVPLAPLSEDPLDPPRPCRLPFAPGLCDLDDPPFREDLEPLPRPCFPGPCRLLSWREDSSFGDFFFTVLLPPVRCGSEDPPSGESPSEAMTSPAEDVSNDTPPPSMPPMPSMFPPVVSPAGSGVVDWFISFTCSFAFNFPAHPEFQEPHSSVSLPESAEETSGPGSGTLLYACLAPLLHSHANGCLHGSVTTRKPGWFGANDSFAITYRFRGLFRTARFHDLENALQSVGRV